MDRLLQWGVVRMNVCIFCSGDAETCEHLFFNCPYAQVVWQHTQRTLMVPVILGKWTMILQAFIDEYSEDSFLDTVTISAVVHQLWMERNGRLFGPEVKPRMIRETISSWRNIPNTQHNWLLLIV